MGRRAMHEARHAKRREDGRERGYAGRHEERYATRFGVGRLMLRGDLPLELELPGDASLEYELSGDASLERDLCHRASLGRERSGSADAARPVACCTSTPWVRLLERYFAGERVAFPLDLEAFLDVHGFTAFERDVLRALWSVPYGAAVGYRDLAAAAGRPHAYRATGSVMAKNPLPVILPCHRVLKSDGSYGHYGDDPTWKPRLLELEGWDGRWAELTRVERIGASR